MTRTRDQRVRINAETLNPRDCGKETQTGIRSTSMTESWEEIWERSQSSLEAIRNSVSTLASPTPRVLRVSQLDAESLDTELVELLRAPIANALSVANVRLCALFRKNACFNP